MKFYPPSQVVYSQNGSHNKTFPLGLIINPTHPHNVSPITIINIDPVSYYLALHLWPSHEIGRSVHS